MSATSTTKRASRRVGLGTICERLQANHSTPDIADFLRLKRAGKPDLVLSYRDWLCRAQVRAQQFAQDGLQPRDRVLLLLPHGPELYESFVAALLGGQIPVIAAPPSPKISAEQYARTLRALLDNCNPAAVLTTAEVEATLPAGWRPGDSAPIWRLEPLAPQRRPPTITWPSPDFASRDDVAFLQYSSGTTGAKKGVAITHRALLAQLDAYATAIRLQADDRIASWLPLYHDMGLICCLLLPLVTRTPLVAQCPFEWVRRPESWLSAVSEHRCTLSWMPNFAYHFLAQLPVERWPAALDLSSLRALINCSEPITDSAHEALFAAYASCGLARTALCTCYAMAETTFAVTSGGFAEPAPSSELPWDSTGASEDRAAPTSNRRLVSSGRALPGVEIRIIDPSGERVADGNVGEIVIRCPWMLKEYFRNPGATRAACRDGWLHTEDAGFLRDGQLYVLGRRKDLLNIRGQNIFPQDVEEIANNVPGVIPGRTAAIAVTDADLDTQALVVLCEAHLPPGPERDNLAREVRNAIVDGLGVAPREVVVAEHMWLLKSTSGKISRALNRERYLAGRGRAAASASQPAAGPRAERIQSIVAQVVRTPTPPESLQATQSLVRSGLIDSLGVADLLARLETAFQIRIPDAELADPGAIDTIASLDALVERLSRSEPSIATKSASDSSDTTPLRARRTESLAPEIHSPTDKPHSADAPRTRTPATAVRTVRRSFSERFWSAYYAWLLRMRGVRCGRGLRVLGPILLRLESGPRSLVIGDQVTLMPGVDLKTRESGRIILEDRVVLDTGVRLVAANQARLHVMQAAQIGMASIINAGEDVTIGRRSAIAGHCTILSSEHRFDGPEPIWQQGYHHAPVHIEDDVWLASNVFVGPGVKIGDGAVIGVRSVITRDVPARAVVAGHPPRIVKWRPAG